ncbi:MAG: murein hydrolase activator EnvC family protein [Rhodomicrobium sp.]
MTFSILPLQLLRSICFGVAAGCLLAGLQPVRAEPAAGTSSASPVIQPNAQQSRAGPKRRKGKEGSEEAKIDADQARELYIRRKLRLEQIQAEQKEISKDQRTLAANRARMHARLIETARALRLSEKRLTEIEEHLAQTRAKVKEQREKLDDKSAQMSALFVLMQSMSRQPPPVMITHSKDALKMIRSGMVLAAFYADVEKLASQIAAEVERLDQAQREAEQQEQRRKSEQAQNSRLKSQIDLLLIENSEQLELASENLENLKNANQINLTGLKSLEEMLPALDAAAGKKAKSALGEDEVKSAGDAASAPAKFASLQIGRMEPSIPFANSQGLLPMPAQGRMLIKFGQAGSDGAASKGIHIETRPGAQVVSPCDGSILYAGPFRSYGQLLIIDPGGGYHVVIAGMDRIQVTRGQAVLAGEPVATMGADPRSGEKTSARPILYVEFRRDQQSIDPAPWWSAGGKG